MTKTQKRALAKLDREWRSAIELGETDTTMLALASKRMIEAKAQNNTRYYKRIGGLK